MDRYQRRVQRLRKHVLENNEKLNETETIEFLSNAENLEFEDLTVPELKKIVKEKGIAGYSDMTKPELLEILEGD